MPTPSSSSAGHASEIPATTSSTGITICESNSPTTFSSSTPTTSTCFSIGVFSNSESTCPSLGAPISTNQQRNETGFSVYSTAATSTTEGFSSFTTATSGDTVPVSGPVSAYTIPVSTDRSPVTADTASVLADTSLISADKPSVSADFCFGAKTNTNASSEFSFGNTRSSGSFGDFKTTAATTIADTCTIPCFGTPISTTSAPTGYAFRADTCTIPCFGTPISNTSAATGYAFGKATTETSVSPFRGEVTTTTAQSNPFSLSTRPTTPPAFRFDTRPLPKGSQLVASGSTSTAAISVTPVLGISSTLTATHAFPTGFQFGSPATALLPKASGFKFSTLATGVPSEPSGFQFGALTTAVTSTATPPLPTGLSLMPKAPATASENDFTIAAPSGTTIKFDPPTGTDDMLKAGYSQIVNTRFQCITLMKEYENKSLEELRVEDYAANRKGGGAGGIAVESTTQQTWAATASASGFSFGNTKPLFVTTGTTNYLMAYPDFNWESCCDDWYINLISTERVVIIWNIRSFLRKCLEESKRLRSYDFRFADARWNMFTSLDRKNVHSLFGINVRPPTLSDTFDCYFKITFTDNSDREIRKIEFNFKCLDADDSYGAVTDFLSSFELDMLLQLGEKLHCSITLKKSSIKEAFPQAEIPHSGISKAVDAHTQTPVLENEDHKLCQDLKKLLLSEEGSDVTLQLQDEQFKAHRSILTARSSVFAATFRHGTKEKATGVVDIEDCEPSAFPVLLEFIYCGTTEKLSVENMFDLYTSSDKYDVGDLKMKCLQFIQSNISVDTFCKTLRLALQHSETNLLKLATEFFVRNCPQITETSEWQTFLSENPIEGNELFIKVIRNIPPTPR